MVGLRVHQATGHEPGVAHQEARSVQAREDRPRSDGRGPFQTWSHVADAKAPPRDGFHHSTVEVSAPRLKTFFVSM